MKICDVCKKKELSLGGVAKVVIPQRRKRPRS